jgi:hypothetical protein
MDHALSSRPPKGACPVDIGAMFDELWGKLLVSRLPGVPKPHPRSDKQIGKKVITCRAGTG